ncbi:ATP-binding cassette domain-containing protein [Actinoplanes sp. N902-109]|uniref:ATP-binding cassette domain-containing protein n=1 Tax=Actinoplanes sp. (strain N902-109) TaxID=649831 RepID=UPI0012F806F3
MNNLSFSVSEGVTVLLGPNGAGKTTLLEMIATIRRPASGALRVLGESADRSRTIREIRRRTGYLPQTFGYYPAFTAAEFVEYCAWLKKVPKHDIKRAARDALERVELSDRADDAMRTLSGGMIRRVGIAQAVVNSPELVVLDEPTVGLDPQQRIEFRNLIRTLSDRTSFLVSTHLVDEVKHVADAVLVLDRGRMVFDGSAGKLESMSEDDAIGDTPLERGYSSVLRPLAEDVSR